MLDIVIQHFQIYVIAHIVTLLIFAFGAIIAVASYWFVLVHVWAYEILKEVYNGIFSANA